jgi:hypothetical protein
LVMRRVQNAANRINALSSTNDWGIMRRIAFLVLATAFALTGCTSPEDEAAEKAQDAEDMWLAMGGEGEMPSADAESIRAVIEEATDRANDVLINGSNDEDCVAFGDAFMKLTVADFDDERQDYMGPIKNALSQIDNGCSDRGTWEGVVDDVVDVSELGGEYLSRF